MNESNSVVCVVDDDASTRETLRDLLRSAGLKVQTFAVLEEKSYERAGEEKTRQTNVRIIAATNRDLKKEVAAGRFREDLYYRLNVFPLRVATLRERKEDIPLLATYFIEVLVKELGCPKPRLTQTGIEMLLAYHWPGSRIVVPLCPAAAVLNHLTPSSRGSTPRARRTESRKVARSRTHTICRIL